MKITFWVENWIWSITLKVQFRESRVKEKYYLRYGGARENGDTQDAWELRKGRTYVKKMVKECWRKAIDLNREKKMDYYPEDGIHEIQSLDWAVRERFCWMTIDGIGTALGPEDEEVFEKKKSGEY